MRQLNAKGQEIECNHLSDQVQTFASADIPLSVLLDFCEDPRFDECASCDHHTIHAALFSTRPIVLRRITVASTENWNSRYCGPVMSTNFRALG